MSPGWLTEGGGPVRSGAACFKEGSKWTFSASEPKFDRRDIICLVNYLDDLATGIAQGLYIEDIIRDHVSSIFKHAVENFIHTGLIDNQGIEKVVTLYDRWFPRLAPTTSYRSGVRPPNSR